MLNPKRSFGENMIHIQSTTPPEAAAAATA